MAAKQTGLMLSDPLVGMALAFPPGIGMPGHYLGFLFRNAGFPVVDLHCWICTKLEEIPYSTFLRIGFLLCSVVVDKLAEYYGV